MANATMKRHSIQGPAASVTTIISETASEANKKKLEMWAKSNPGVKEAAAERGTAIHSCMEMFLKKEVFDVPQEYQEFWTGMPEILEQFDEVLWAEKHHSATTTSSLYPKTGLGACGAGTRKRDHGWAVLTSLVLLEAN